MNSMQIIWLSLGTMLGIGHALAIWRSVNAASTASLHRGLARLFLVGLLLIGAAVFGGIAPAATGWFVGFAAGVVNCLRQASRADARTSV